MNTPHTAPIKVSLNTDRIASCQACGKANYNGSFGTKKEVDTLVRIEINTAGRSNMTTVTTMCPDCLQELTQLVHPFRSGI